MYSWLFYRDVTSSCGISAILMLNCASATPLSLNLNYQMWKHSVMDFTFDVGLATGFIKYIYVCILYA